VTFRRPRLLGPDWERGQVRKVPARKH